MVGFWLSNREVPEPGEVIKVQRGFCSIWATVVKASWFRINSHDFQIRSFDGSFITTGKHSANVLANDMGFDDHETMYKHLTGKYPESYYEGYRITANPTSV